MLHNAIKIYVYVPTCVIRVNKYLVAGARVHAEHIHNL